MKRFNLKRCFCLMALLAMFPCFLFSGCSSSTPGKANIRQYPQNRPADWERNNGMNSMNMPGVSF